MMANEDLASGRSVEWLTYDYWKETGYYDWEDRCPYGIISPLAIIETVRGTPAHLAFKDDPLDGDKIFEFSRDVARLNIRFDDWTSARCFFPRPGDLVVPYRYFFFGTTKDMMTLKMVLSP